MRQIAERLVLDLVAVAIAAAKQMGDVLAALILPPRSDDVNCPTSLCHGANQCTDLPTTSIHFSDYIMQRCNRALLPSAGVQPARHDTGLEGELQPSAPWSRRRARSPGARPTGAWHRRSARAESSPTRAAWPLQCAPTSRARHIPVAVALYPCDRPRRHAPPTH